MSSNAGMKARQFVNVVTEKCSGGVYALRRVKASDIFYGSTEEALLKEAEQDDKNAVAAMTRSRLPKPRIKFNQSRPVDGRMDFWPFYGSANDNEGSSKILCVDAARQAVLYDAGAETLKTLPRLHEPKGSDDSNPVVLSVAPPDAHDPSRADALYVMDAMSGSFEALVYDDPSPDLIGRCCSNAFVWHWRRLPLPPCVLDRNSSHGCVNCYALLPADGGGSTICVSSFTDSAGTHCFNTASERWTRAGSWSLPFCGRAQVVPQLDGLCFGVASRSPNHLCAMDMSSISTDGGGGARRPKLRYQWPVMDTPGDWMLTKISMAYIGAGRFCIAKTFCIHDKDTGHFVDDETVLNGVEVVRENGATTSRWTKSKLQMIRHKSVRYGSLNHRIKCVL